MVTGDVGMLGVVIIAFFFTYEPTGELRDGRLYLLRFGGSVWTLYVLIYLLFYRFI
ncbi:hypothetical protein BZA05DRAFT_412631 [Tricharina praecox]|uniref:uncharacterized protein n=1 Tax=Tricharina praecox TaxID=43433 RepID=UPI002220DB18|nr:uncharacterized protein BZA05DRAFT_412631 [Tricharina praecox]KAI5842030.1 hypothetical protein BZA05DRAFT_412631 [Tricharina praecox]